MNELEKAKARYLETPIPAELHHRVRIAIRQGRQNRSRKNWHRSFAAAAACLAMLMGVLNLSPGIAMAAADVPLLGGLFQILTIRSYAELEDGVDYQLNVPAVEADSETAARVNAEIEERVDALLAKAQSDWQDYQTAFFATGGTQEEWGERQMDVIVNYEIKSQTETTVSFVVDFAEGWVSAQQQRFCYNLDLENDRDITLADLLGEDWVEICNNSILAQIEASVDDEGFSYFFPAERGGFTTVDTSTSFYIRDDGTPVVVFPEYTIASGAAGIVEFPIR